MGTLLGSGRLSPWDVVPAAMVGAILGYGLSYHGGAYLGRGFARHRRLRKHRRSVARARLFFSRHGGPSIIFGRYALGPFQSLLPFVAGTVRMPVRRFWVINVASGVIWVLVTLTPGYLVARSLNGVPLGPHWQDEASAVLIAVSGGAVVICIGAVFVKSAAQLFRQARQRSN